MVKTYNILLETFRTLPKICDAAPKNHVALTDFVAMPHQMHTTLTDPELYALCKRWGAEALQARRKFIGLLPEVNARRLYERRKFRSIYHFAAVLGGVGGRLVDDVLRLEKRFEAMPKLHAALVNGEIGLSKLSRIVSVVEVGNEAEVCEKIRSLSKRAVDIFVREMMGVREENAVGVGLFEEQAVGIRDFEKSVIVMESRKSKGGGVCLGKDGCDEAGNSGRSFENHVSACGHEKIVNSDSSSENHIAIDSRPKPENQNGSQKPLLSPKSPPGRGKQNTSSLNFDYEILNALSPEVKAKLKELIDKEIDINPILLNALAEREAKITEKKAEIGATPAKSRYIPAQTRKIIIEEFGTKCSYPNCQNPAEQLHHEKPYAAYRDHDPRNLKPLCRGHHELAHVR